MKKTLWIVGAAVAAKSLLTRIFEPDLWWHLALARQMVAEHGVTRTEIYSHTYLGAPYINFEWLAQLGFYAVWAATGLAGIFVVKILLGAAVAFLLYKVLRAWGVDDLRLPILWWGAFWVLRPRLNERPELATLLALPALLLLIRHALRKPTFHRRAYGIAFALAVVWANAHGGWVYGPALAGLLAVGAWWSEKYRPSARFLVILSAVMTLGGMVNPYGPHVLIVHTIHLAHLAKAGSVASVIEEWGPTSVAMAPVFWALFAAAAAALVSGLLTRSAAARLWAPAVIVFAASGAGFYRNAGLFAFVAGPFLVQWIAEKKRPKLALGLVSFVGVIALGPAAIAAVRPIPHNLIQWQRFPVAACRFLEEEDIRGRMFNALDQGGYIEWAVGPERKVFIDGRYLFFPLVKDLADAVRNGTVRDLIDGAGLDHAVVNYFLFDAVGMTADKLFPPDRWALVFWDDAGLVYLRRTPAFQNVIARREYRVFRPDIPYISAGDRAAEEARHRREVPLSIVRDRLNGG